MISKLTNKEIKPFMTFGKMPIANGFLNKEDFEKEFFIFSASSSLILEDELLAIIESSLHLDNISLISTEISKAKSLTFVLTFFINYCSSFSASSSTSSTGAFLNFSCKAVFAAICIFSTSSLAVMPEDF